ncbi:glycosyltransferase family 25 protein [Mesorhizobium sp. M0621]|uniref:glycosyltransferase family 25 protein n=1 Tax=Mesorhizobium sp. M0621 TaxID=2956974 RepID=UPI00333CBA3D
MKTFPNDVFVRVCHVKTGYEDRERHILKELGSRGIPVNWFLDYDVSDIQEKIREEFSETTLSAPQISCSLKHIGVWQEFLTSGLPYCLVLEDDVFLTPDFVDKLKQGIAELGNPNRKVAIYLGNAGNYYLPIWRISKRQKLYPAPHSRATDSYLITRPTAEARCDWFSKNKMTTTIGHQLDRTDPLLGVEVLWFERPIVEQGTHNGAFPTSIPGQNKWRPLWYKRLEWNWKKARRRIFGHI